MGRGPSSWLQYWAAARTDQSQWRQGAPPVPDWSILDGQSLLMDYHDEPEPEDLLPTSVSHLQLSAEQVHMLRPPEVRLQEMSTDSHTAQTATPQNSKR